MHSRPSAGARSKIEIYKQQKYPTAECADPNIGQKWDTLVGHKPSERSFSLLTGRRVLHYRLIRTGIRETRSGPWWLCHLKVMMLFRAKVGEHDPPSAKAILCPFEHSDPGFFSCSSAENCVSNSVLITIVVALLAERQITIGWLPWMRAGPLCHR